MNPKPWIQWTVEVPPALEEIVLDWMEDVFGTVPVSERQGGQDLVRITVYTSLENQPDETQLRRLRQSLRQLTAVVDPKRKGILRRRLLHPQKWETSWKRFFRPQRFGEVLFLRAPWHRRRAPKGMIEVVLTPGLSFGTGQHPTTRYCLDRIVFYRPKEHAAASLLDVGTGSGILAIAAAKLGYHPVEAFDCDEQAVQTARKNAQANGLETQVRIYKGDLLRLRPVQHGRFDVVCANLTADLLKRRAEALASRIRPGGVLVVAGILSDQFPEVRSALEQHCGLTLVHEQQESGWTGGTFQKPHD